MNKAILLLLPLAALTGCMELATRSNGEAGPSWQPAKLASSQPTVGGAKACFYRAQSSTYTVTSHNGCPEALMIDVNSYRLHIDPLTQGYQFKYKCLVAEQCPNKDALPIVAAPGGACSTVTGAGNVACPSN